MSIKAILGLSLLFISIFTTKVRVSVDRNKGPTCFYQNLKLNQKYQFRISSDIPNYRLDVMYSKSGRGSAWKQVVSKMGKRMTENINKIAQLEGVYTFCVSTTESNAFKATLTIQTGLQQGNFQYLPSFNDQDMLNRQIDWMDKQKQKVIEVLTKMEGQKSVSESLKNNIGVMMIVLAILGVVVLAAVNFAFYFLAKKGLKDRKLI